MTAADFTPARIAELREFDHGAIFDELHTFEELEDAWIEMLDAIEELRRVIDDMRAELKEVRAVKRSWNGVPK